MRQGYQQLTDALRWMGKNSTRSMDTKIGGVMEPGKHEKCECIEIWDGGTYKDYVFLNSDLQEFKQRVYRDKHVYKLGAFYKLVIKADFGDVHIETGGDGNYRLINKSGTLILSSKKIGDLYVYAKNNRLSIIYNSIVWSEELQPEPVASRGLRINNEQARGHSPSRSEEL